jgi:hypothetical protein
MGRRPIPASLNKNAKIKGVAVRIIKIKQHLLALLCLIILPFFGNAFGQVGEVLFNPQSITVQPSDTFEIAIEADENLSGIHCFFVTVAFDTTLLELNNVTEGPLLPDSGETFFFWQENEDIAGQYDIGSCLLGYGLYASGPGLLATMEFRGKGLNGNTDLIFTDIVISDTLLDTLDVNSANGLVNLAGDQIPDFDILSPETGGIYNSLPSLTIQFTDDFGLNRPYYQIDNCEGAWQELWSYNSNSSDTIISWQIPGLSEGLHEIYFKVEDDGGNTNSDTCSYSWMLTFDATPPDFQILDPLSEGLWDEFPSLSIQFQDNLGINRGFYQIDNCEGTWQEIWSYNCNSNDTTALWQLPTLAEGTHSIYVKTLDDADNTNIDTCSYSWLFTYDVTPATVQVLDPPSGGNWDELPTLSIRFQDNINLNQGYYQIDGCSEQWNELWLYNSNSSDTTISWMVPSISEGSHEIFFKITDDLNHVNSDSCSFTWNFTYGGLYICGDANADQGVNVSDAVYVINYVFIGGNPPNPLESGDCNCDGAVNVSDAVWVINFVFIGGNEPCDTDGDGNSDC